MAILTALLSALSRKLGSLIQAIMGWSVAALFGRLSPSKRLMISIAMILSVLWPIFVVGVFFPAAAAVVIAFVPVRDLLSQTVIRVIWIVLAVVAPLVVGLHVHAVAGERSRGVGRALLNGYPLALGFAISFVVTVITVPLIKIASAARGWEEAHLPVQPRPGAYEAVLRDLSEACVYAGLEPEVRSVPWSMAISTQVIKFFARGGVDALIADDPKCVRAEGLQLYLYPGDLLLRGEEHKVARVRAVLGSTMLERDAWLVESEPAQHLQDELGRLWEALQRHRFPDDATAGLKSRLEEIAADSTKPGISYEDWVMVDRITRRVEGRLQQQKKSVVDEQNLHRAKKTTDEDSRPALLVSPSDASTVQLVEAAFKETKELVRIEVALAKVEATRQAKAALRAGIAFGAAAVLGIIALTLGAVAIVLALGGSPGNALVVALGVVLLGATAGLAGYSMLPKHPLEHTRQHLEDDFKQLKEHLA